MNGTSYIDDLIARKQPVMIRLTEGRDILAVPIAQDPNTLIIQNSSGDSTSLIYKKSVSVITPIKQDSLGE